MKTKFTIFTGLFIIFSLLTGYINGPAASVSASFTGAPFENGILCSNCHSEATYGSISTTIEVFEQGTNIPVDSAYEAGKPYDIQVSVNSTSSVPIGFGFQCVVVDQFGGSIGSFMNPQANTKIVTLPNGIDVAEHNGISIGGQSNVFRWEWFSPVFLNNSSINAHFYSTGVAANGNGFPTGDGGSPVSGTIVLEGPLPPLPVELIDFSGTNVDNQIHLLEWSTASEQDADYFTLEHSTDDESFKPIAQIAAAGTTIERQDYAFRYTQPSTGVNYYRLVQTDFDGTRNMFKSVSIYQYEPLELVKTYPVPATDVVHLEIRYQKSGLFLLEVIGSSGQCFKEEEINLISGFNSLSLDIKDLPGGFYTINLSDGKSSMMNTIIKF